MNLAVLRTLLNAGFSRQTASAMAQSGVFQSLEELRTEPWGDERKVDGGLGWRLKTIPRLGPKGIAEVKSFRAAHDSECQAKRGVRHVLYLSEELVGRLDDLIARDPVRMQTREDMIVDLVSAAAPPQTAAGADRRTEAQPPEPMRERADTVSSPLKPRTARLNLREAKRSPVSIPAYLFDPQGAASASTIIDRSRSGIRVLCTNEEFHRKSSYILRLDTGLAYAVCNIWIEGKLGGYRLMARKAYSVCSVDPAIQALNATWSRHLGHRDSRGLCQTKVTDRLSQVASSVEV